MGRCSEVYGENLEIIYEVLDGAVPRRSYFSDLPMAE